MKKIIFLLAICLISSMSFAEIIESGNLNENIAWTLDSEGTLMINGEGEMPDYTSENNPPWFQYREKITSIKIKGVSTIGDYAFNNCYLTTYVEIPNSVIQFISKFTHNNSNSSPQFNKYWTYRF